MEKATTPDQAVPALPPEEGFAGWLCVAGASICLFCSFGFLSAIGVFQTFYQQSTLHDYSPSNISWIFAVQLALMWAPGPLYGRVVDTYGAAPVLWPGAFLCVLGLCMTSLSTEYYQIFLAQGLCFGIGSGAVFSVSFVCVGQWFVRRRGLGIGVASTGSSLGGVIFPLFLDRVVKDVGFYGAVRYTALFIGILLVIACCMVRSRLPRRKWNRDTPWFDVMLFKEKQFAFYVVGSYLVMWGLWGPFDFISSMAIEAADFSPTLGLYLISLINATSVPGRTLPAWLGDHVGHFNVITACCFLTSIDILALWLPFNYYPSHAGLIVFALLYGFVSGAFVSLLMPCAGKSGTLETLGQRFGTFQAVISVSTLTGLPIMGSIVSRQGGDDYTGLVIFSGVSCLLGTMLLATSTYLLRRKLGTWKV